jgi:quercetin dioxygenase-like cupin family protein
MTTTAASTEAFWFFDSLARVRVSRDEGEGRLSVIEMTAPRGSMPPLHVHSEDETSYVLEGALTIFAGERVERLAPGDSLLAPRGVPHTYVAEAEGTRMLVVTKGDFESFVRAVSRPAERETLPPASDGPPSAEELEALGKVAAEYGIEFLGPPGMLPSDLR